jgi:hypothetical protein
MGGASATIIRAEVNAEDHIRAKTNPIAKARKSTIHLKKLIFKQKGRPA